MSYILEALKKSQRQRELGHAPRLEENWLEQLPDRAEPHPWMIGTAILAALALAIALYAVLRSMPDSPAPEEPSVVVSEPGVLPSFSATTDPASTVLQSADSENAATERASEHALQAPLQLDDPVNLSVQPNLMFVPAPEPQGRPLPRGADEIRRAVLGDDLSRSVKLRQDASPGYRLPLPLDGAQENGIPEDLKAEIDAFKQGVRRRGRAQPINGLQPAIVPDINSTANAGAGLAEHLGMPTDLGAGASTGNLHEPVGPSPGLRQRLPPYSISVHVYNNAAGERFIYLNGRKTHEQEVTPEGLKIEEITPAGVILSFEGEHFFERR